MSLCLDMRYSHAPSARTSALHTLRPKRLVLRSSLALIRQRSAHLQVQQAVIQHAAAPALRQEPGVQHAHTLGARRHIVCHTRRLRSISCTIAAACLLCRESTSQVSAKKQFFESYGFSYSFIPVGCKLQQMRTENLKSRIFRVIHRLTTLKH